MKQILSSLLFAVICAVGSAGTPDRAARPQVWWHWVDGFVSADGVTRDLEAMEKAGIGGATIFDVSAFKTSGPLKTLSPEWFAMVQHAIREAERLGLELGIHNCPGWSSSGGPWITPENAMKELRAVSTVVEGGKEVRLKLPRVASLYPYYRDVAVLAFPALPGDAPEAVPAIFGTSASGGNPDWASLLTGKNRRGIVIDPAKSPAPPALILTYEKPFTAGSVTLEFTAPPWNNAVDVAVAVSDDGRNFRQHSRAGRLLANGEAFAFPRVTAKYFRISIAATRGGILPLTRVRLSGATPIPGIEQKAFYKAGPVDGSRYDIPEANRIDPASIVDLSSRMDADGNLVWQAPAGRWTILRFGMIARRSGNHPATRAGSGLECDKMSRAGIDAIWSGMMERIVREAGPRAGKTLKYVVIDSYEVGPQNWTALMPEHFKRLRGYDPTPFLPVLTGRCVGNPEYSERFLEDFRRTVSDLFAEFYGRYYAEKAHRANLQFVTEPYGGPFDELLQGRAADIPMGEFWANFSSTGNVRLAANIASVNRRKIVQSESFSASSNTGAWRGTPAGYKVQGDAVLCAGVNRLVLHSFVHQPFEADGAGMTMGYWGGFFNRKNTLWDFYSGWFEYLARAQALLQQGRTPADVLYVGGEDTPSPAVFEPGVPSGFGTHSCDAGMFLENASVEDRQWVTLGNGSRYLLVIVPRTGRISVALLARVAELVNAGATVLLGERPERAFGLTGYPASDRKAAMLAELLWGPLNGAKTGCRKVGAGQVYLNVRPQAILNQLRVAPDFFRAPRTGDVRFIHRVLPEGEFYFVANCSRTKEPLSFTGYFRASGRNPEWYDAETDTTRPIPVWRERNGRVEIPLRLAYGESVFVKFRSAPAVAHQAEPVPAVPEAKPVTRVCRTAWQLSFPSGRGAPKTLEMVELTPLNRHADPAVRYYAGTTVYRATVEIVPEELQGGQRLTLDLGQVCDAARLKVNGRDLGLLWRPPFRCDVTSAVKPGANTLEIHVANRWINRLIGDEESPEEGRWEVLRQGRLVREIPAWVSQGGTSPVGRTGFSSFRYWKKGAPLVDAGLIGPVTIERSAR